MINEKINDVFSEAIEQFSTDNQSAPNDYDLAAELLDKGYDFDSSAVYIPYDDNDDEREIYLKITRAEKDKAELIYAWSIREEEGSYRQLAHFTRKKLLAEEETFDVKKADIIQKLSYSAMLSKIDMSKEEAAAYFRDIVIDIINSSCLNIFKEVDYDFQSKDEIAEAELSIVEEAIEQRRCPTLTDEEKQYAIEVEEKIREVGYIPYLSELLDCFHIGSHKNIYRKHIGAFNVIDGKGAYLFITYAKGGEGKSLEDELSFLILIPSEYIFRKNQMTFSSFTRYSQSSIHYFDRMIIYFGDMGGRRSFDDMEQVFDSIKTLITEKFFSKDISEGTSNGGFETKDLTLLVNTIGAVIQTTDENFFNGDEQLESRSIASTTFDVDKDKILDLIFCLKYKDSIENKRQSAALIEIKKYHCYLKSLIAKNIEVINPFQNVFKKMVKHSEVITRDFDQITELFEGFCILTFYDCRLINGKYVCSQKQLKEFINHICLENTLSPIESNFIKMLIGIKQNCEMSKYALTIIDEPSEDDETNLNPLQKYQNAVLEAIGELNSSNQSQLYDVSIETLEDWKRKKAIAKLLEMYKLNGKGMNHVENVFFRVSDIRSTYSNRKVFKDVKDIGNLLNRLYDNGYLGKLEFHDDNKQNIYYLTSKSKEITNEIKITEEDIIDGENFLNRQGVYQKNECES